MAKLPRVFAGSGRAQEGRSSSGSSEEFSSVNVGMQPETGNQDSGSGSHHVWPGVRALAQRLISSVMDSKEEQDEKKQELANKVLPLAQKVFDMRRRMNPESSWTEGVCQFDSDGNHKLTELENFVELPHTYRNRTLILDALDRVSQFISLFGLHKRIELVLGSNEPEASEQKRLLEKGAAQIFRRAKGKDSLSSHRTNDMDSYMAGQFYKDRSVDRRISTEFDKLRRLANKKTSVVTLGKGIEEGVGPADFIEELRQGSQEEKSTATEIFRYFLVSPLAQENPRHPNLIAAGISMAALDWSENQIQGEAHLREIYATKPDLWGTLHERAESYRKEGRSDQAELYEQMVGFVRKGMTDNFAELRKGGGAQKIEALESAAQLLASALSIDGAAHPESINTMLDVAALHFELNESRHGAQLLADAVDANPEMVASILAGRGESWHDLSDVAREDASLYSSDANAASEMENLARVLSKGSQASTRRRKDAKGGE